MIFPFFFPFSVFPSKSFLFIFLFFIYFCVVVVSIRRKKKNKKLLFWGKKGKREKYSQDFQQTPLFYTENVKMGFFPFFSVFPFFYERFSFNKETKKKERSVKANDMFSLYDILRQN